MEGICLGHSSSVFFLQNLATLNLLLWVHFFQMVDFHPHTYDFGAPMPLKQHPDIQIQ